MLEINKIHCGDCLELMKQMPDNSVDLIITSPPYNMGNRVKNWLQTYKVNNEDNMDKKEYFNWIKKCISGMLRITKYHIFFNIQEVQGNKGIISFIFKEFEDSIKEVFIWAKTNPPSHIIETQCSSGYEYIFCFSKDNPKQKMFSHCSFNNRNGDYMRNIIIKGVHRDKNGHNYAFPEWLPEFFIDNFAIKGDKILDPFVGSGTTCYIAKTRGYDYVGIDISEEYCEIARKRVQQETLFAHVGKANK